MRIIATVVAFGAMTGVSFASCNVNDAYTDKQAGCASACEDQYIRDRQHAEPSVNAKAAETQKACKAKCGCADDLR